LPGSRGHAALVSLVRFAASHEQAFDFVLALERDEVPEPRLARRQPHVDAPRESAAGRLGWSVWLKSRPLARDPADAVIRSRPSVLPAAHEPALAGRGRGELDGAEGIPIGG
jgi:predicted component of type VI protein secretion system